MVRLALGSPPRSQRNFKHIMLSREYYDPNGWLQFESPPEAARSRANNLVNKTSRAQFRYAGVEPITLLLKQVVLNSGSVNSVSRNSETEHYVCRSRANNLVK